MDLLSDYSTEALLQVCFERLFGVYVVETTVGRYAPKTEHADRCLDAAVHVQKALDMLNRK